MMRCSPPVAEALETEQVFASGLGSSTLAFGRV